MTYFESAFGGLGGCPFTKVAAGNVCTEDLVHSLQRMGLRKDIDLDKLLEAARDVGALLRPRAARLHPESRLDRRFQESAIKESHHEIAGKVRVLDLTNVLSGPFATLHLALLGAEVIKIENPDGGDLARKLGNVPKLNKQLMGTSFLAQNANKKSLTLNLKAEEGKEIFRKLVETADVRGGELPPRRHGPARLLLRRDLRRSIPGSSTAPSPASARPGPMPSSRPTTRSSRA